MAGDWIKVEHATADKPEVGRIADRLGIDHDAAFGKVIRFWVWADQQAVSGNAFSVTKSAIDRVTYCPGFADALLEVDWLQARSGSFVIPRFDRHNGHSSKQRAETNRRVADHRRKRGNAEGVSHVTESPLQKPLPEKRREEGIRERDHAGGRDDEPTGLHVVAPEPETPPLPDHENTARKIVGRYPRQERIENALRIVLAHLIDGEDPARMLAGVAAGAKVIRGASPAQQRFVPSAESYFRDRRWADDPETLLRAHVPENILPPPKDANGKPIPRRCV